MGPQIVGEDDLRRVSRGGQPEGLTWGSPAPALSEVEGASGERRRAATPWEGAAPTAQPCKDGARCSFRRRAWGLSIGTQQDSRTRCCGKPALPRPSYPQSVCVLSEGATPRPWATRGDQYKGDIAAMMSCDALTGLDRGGRWTQGVASLAPSTSLRAGAELSHVAPMGQRLGGAGTRRDARAWGDQAPPSRRRMSR